MAKKKLVTKVLCFLVVMVILVSTMPAISSNSASGTFELLRNGYSDIGPKHKYLDCGGNVNYFDISVLFNWEDSGVERLKIDASTGESFKSGLYPTACGEDVFILDSACGKITLNYDGLKSDSDGWHYKYSYTIEESDSKPSLSISVWTDKSEYKIGETVKIYYKTNKKCTAKLTITKPDGEKIVYGPNEIPACTRSKSATAGYPTGKRTVVFEAWAGAEYKKATCYFDVIEEKKPKQPSPKIFKVIYPTACVNEGEYATISVTVKNNGGHTSEGYISVSFPNDEHIPRSRVSGTGNGYNELYQKGFWPIWNSKGEQMKSVDPLVELQEKNWRNDQQETITMNVKPNSGSDKIVFYVRAALKSDADGSYERDPTYSGDKDQQGWFVERHVIEVCPSECMADVKFKGTVTIDETNIPNLCYGSYYCNVRIEDAEDILYDPANFLQVGEEYTVAYGQDPKYIKSGDKLDVYGIYYRTCGPLQCVGVIGATSDPYYVNRIFPSYDLTVTDISFSDLPAETKPLTITATVRNNEDDDVSHVWVTFSSDGFGIIGPGFINHIPAHSSATASVTWKEPVKSFEPAPPKYYTNDITVKAGDSSYLAKVMVGDTHGTGYTITHIAPSNLPMDVSNPQFGQLIIFDSKYRYLGTRELKPLSQLLTAVDDLLTASSACACAIGIQLAAASGGSGGAFLLLCSGNILVAGTTTIAANLLNHMAENWPEQLDFSSKDIEPSSDGKIHILCVISLDTVTENGETTSNSYNLDYYYEDEMGNWVDYYHTVEYITDQSSNQISATIDCPANLHAYDSQGRHVGVNAQEDIDLEIPGAYYTDPDSEPESIVIFDQTEDITFKVDALDVGEFNFTVTQTIDAKTTTVTYLDVPITETTEATVDVSQANPTYTMEIDNNGDGITDYTNEPDSIETMGSESPVHNLNTGEDFATIQNAIDDPDTQDWHTITVDPGTCTEQLVIDKSLKLMGEDKNTTIIEGGGINGSCVHVTADNVEIRGFMIRNGLDGVLLESSDGCTISGNIIQDNGKGIHLTDSNNNMITNNSLFNNVLSLSGIHLSSSHNNVIRDNDLVENDIGVSLRDSNNNLIYHNNFIDNIIRQAFDDSGTNSWDKCPTDGGNYWSDHSCIGNPSDKSYSIYTDGVDHYPFQESNGWLKRNQPPVTSGNAGAISVSSSPSGAAIHLEGFVGPSIKTPYTITNVPVGMSTITLSLDGYQDWSTSVYVMAGKTSYVDAILTPTQTAGPISVASSHNIPDFLRLIK